MQLEKGEKDSDKDALESRGSPEMQRVRILNKFFLKGLPLMTVLRHHLPVRPIFHDGKTDKPMVPSMFLSPALPV
eukprot:5206885-Karenia_brevis.AAC.1